jgi:mono/diheme cytochrome c family protein
MLKGKTMIWLRSLCAGLLLSMAAPALAVDHESASIARGGRLYDNWAKEIGATRLHQMESGREGHKSRPERCVTCHGWDYRGKDGTAAGRNGQGQLVKGITGASSGDAGRIAELLLDERHRYGDYLEPADRQDIALFITRGQVSMDPLIDGKTLRANGQPSAGNVFFQTVCANCHGNDGQQIAEAQPLGDAARANPWLALHTLFNGHPGGNMPALRALDPAVLLNTLAFVQTLPARDPLASIVRGGRLYDTWYKENGRTVPSGVHPAYPGKPPAVIDARTTWRCKECHGWDYRGKDGAYGADEHKTGIAGIRAMAGADPQAIAAKFSGANHAYGKLLSTRDAADLANFISRGQIDMDEFIDRKTLKARGDSARYAAHYHTICATCHGSDGLEVRTMPPLGRIATSDPWRALHGIMNGHPGEPMPPLIALPREAASGILAYIQTLPVQKGSRAEAGQPK